MRPELPTGTVTFLFTDVEGSTKLLHELGAERYAEALVEHRRLIRDACAAHDGVEVDTQGDAFFLAFPTAPGAIAAAEAMTEALAAGPIQVRIGLHTGAPLLAAEGYVGDDVHLGARIAASAHGGQVVLSRATRELARRRSRRARRAPPQGHCATGLDLPARRRALPASEHALEHEPPEPSQLVRRPRARGGASPRPRTQRRPPRDADRRGWNREDAARDRGRVRARAGLPERRRLDPPCVVA